MPKNLQDREDDGELPVDVVRACRPESHATEAPSLALLLPRHHSLSVASPLLCASSAAAA
jgi:hypothetical protein